MSETIKLADQANEMHSNWNIASNGQEIMLRRNPKSESEKKSNKKETEKKREREMKKFPFGVFVVAGFLPKYLLNWL